VLITDKQRAMLHEAKPAIEILCHANYTTLIVGDECYQHVTGLSLNIDGLQDRTLHLILDADAFAKDFEMKSTSTKAEADKAKSDGKNDRQCKHFLARLCPRIPIRQKHVQ